MFKSAGLFIVKVTSKVTVIKQIQNIYLALTPPDTSPEPHIFLSMDNDAKVDVRGNGRGKYVYLGNPYTKCLYGKSSRKTCENRNFTCKQQAGKCGAER